MTVLVTGGAGQVASAIDKLAPGAGIAVTRVGRPDFDFERPETIAAVMAAARPSIVVNAAAYTAVDAAEADAEAARRANTEGPAILARLCAEAGIPLLHLSTDYVFDGSKGAPYVETDAVAPLGVYGATKQAGEAAVLAACDRALVLRTSWVVSATGKNFVKTMVTVGRKMDQLKVVGDQIGCPTTADALAGAILTVLARLREGGWKHEYAGLYHAAGSGYTSWHGLAEAVFEEAASHGLRKPTVAAITTADWPTPVKRPADSRLECGKLARTFGATLPDWRESLRPVVAELMAG
jgi:dTDP-4-dehydrorhamnose reductase